MDSSDPLFSALSDTLMPNSIPLYKPHSSWTYSIQVVKLTSLPLYIVDLPKESNRTSTAHIICFQLPPSALHSEQERTMTTTISAAPLRFETRAGEPQVAIITGAARGLGRVWALALAARGVRVLVNDNDPDRGLVDAVVREITERGGEALADYSSVVNGADVVQHALQRWKRIDILINVRR